MEDTHFFGSVIVRSLIANLQLSVDPEATAKSVGLKGKVIYEATKGFVGTHRIDELIGYAKKLEASGELGEDPIFRIQRQELVASLESIMLEEDYTKHFTDDAFFVKHDATFHERDFDLNRASALKERKLVEDLTHQLEQVEDKAQLEANTGIAYEDILNKINTLEITASELRLLALVLNVSLKYNVTTADGVRDDFPLAG